MWATDAPLLHANPALLTDLIAATADIGTPIMLLHCWLYHREAGYLGHVWPDVCMDVGEALPHVGHRGPAVLAEALELAPWHKVLYSSDEPSRLAALVASGNARRVYPPLG